MQRFHIQIHPIQSLTLNRISEFILSKLPTIPLPLTITGCADEGNASFSGITENVFNSQIIVLSIGEIDHEEP